MDFFLRSSPQWIYKGNNVSTKVIPIVVGALGVVSSRLEGYIKAIGIPDVLGGLQTSAVFQQ